MKPFLPNSIIITTEEKKWIVQKTTNVTITTRSPKDNDRYQAELQEALNEYTREKAVKTSLTSIWMIPNIGEVSYCRRPLETRIMQPTLLYACTGWTKELQSVPWTREIYCSPFYLIALRMCAAFRISGEVTCIATWMELLAIKANLLHKERNPCDMTAEATRKDLHSRRQQRYLWKRPFDSQNNLVYKELTCSTQN